MKGGKPISFILPTTSALNQSLSLQLPLSGGTKLLQVDLRYHKAPGLWFLSVTDRITGELLCSHLPLRASYGAVNDLLKPFRYRGLGSLCCFPSTRRDTPSDPGPEDLSDFNLIWSEPLS